MREKAGKRREAPQIANLWRKNLVVHEVVNWSNVSSDVIRGAIDAVARGGGATMLGTTSDGGAYSICVLLDQDKLKEYPHSVDECEQVLRSLCEYMAERL